MFVTAYDLSPLGASASADIVMNNLMSRTCGAGWWHVIDLCNVCFMFTHFIFDEVSFNVYIHEHFITKFTMHKVESPT